jgi:transglutaminase-like putative cysteine protease
MRIHLAYETVYAYDQPPRTLMQVLRLTPRNHEGQRVGRWRVQSDGDGRLRKGEDALGNVIHTLSLDRPGPTLVIAVQGEATTADTAGVVRGSVEPFPPAVFLRETPLTAPDGAVRDFAHGAVRGSGSDALSRMHALMAAVNGRIGFDTGATDVTTTAAETLSLGHGVCQDITHLFVSAARVLGAPARYVSGHLVRTDGDAEQPAAHAWAEAYVDGLGWVGFDGANGVCPTDAYLRVAVGLDYLGAAPVRGSRVGGGGETLSVRVRAVDAADPASPAHQSQ